MFHTDSSLNWRAIGKRHSLLNESDYQQNTCLNLDSCLKLERVCIKDSDRTKHGISE